VPRTELRGDGERRRASLPGLRAAAPRLAARPRAAMEAAMSDEPRCPTCGEDALDERPKFYGAQYWCESCNSLKTFDEGGR
jgi:hypothetical protein